MPQLKCGTRRKLGGTMQYKTKSSRLRVLIATPRAFPFMGGVENHVYQVATRMARSGIDVTVVSGDTSGDLPKSECVEGVTMRRVPVWPRGGDFYFSPDFYRVIKAGHPDGAPWDLRQLGPHFLEIYVGRAGHAL